MPYNMYATTKMLVAIKKLYPVYTWLKNRYFPTTDDDIFSTTQVLVETKKGNRKMAPFVLPVVGGVVMEREGYQAYLYEPPFINPKRTLTLDDTMQKDLGESMFSNISPEERQERLLGEDLRELYDAADRTQEWMCAQLLTKGEIVMEHLADAATGKTVKKMLRYYDKEEGFQNEYVPAVNWGEDGSDIYGDLDAMVKSMNENSVPVADIILHGDLTKVFLEDEKIQKLYDIRRMNMGTIEPIETPDGVSYLGTITVRGKNLNIFAMDAVVDGESVLPEGTVIVTAPGMGRMLYGAVSQVEQSDGVLHTYRGAVVPKYISDSRTNIREVMVTSKPVPVPKDLNGWIFAKVK